MKEGTRILRLYMFLPCVWLSSHMGDRQMNCWRYHRYTMLLYTVLLYCNRNTLLVATCARVSATRDVGVWQWPFHVMSIVYQQKRATLMPFPPSTPARPFETRSSFHSMSTGSQADQFSGGPAYTQPQKLTPGFLARLKQSLSFS